MKPFKFLTNVILVLFLTTSVSFGQNIKLKVNDSIKNSFSINMLSKNLKDILNENTTGWGYQIWKKHKIVESESGGIRLAAVDNAGDSTNIAFDVNQRMHIASISKTITAIAMSKNLTENKLDWSTQIKDYLPKHWKVHPTLLKTTFGQLLEMRSGLKAQNDAMSSSYFNLKSLIEEGVDTSKIGKYQYQNVSYGLLRILIAELEGYSHQNKNIDSAMVEVNSSNAYVNYINEKIFKPLNIQNVVCRETSSYPTMMYPFPYRGEKGLVSGYAGFEESNGDLTNYVGGLGWYVSIEELGKLLSEFYNTDTVVSKKSFDILLKQRFPFYISKNKKSQYISGMGMWIWSKPNSQYNVGLNTIYVLYPNDILVVVFVNSKGKGIHNLKKIVTEAYYNSFLN